jgi:hypothetical protein
VWWLRAPSQGKPWEEEEVKMGGSAHLSFAVHVLCMASSRSSSISLQPRPPSADPRAPPPPEDPRSQPWSQNCRPHIIPLLKLPPPQVVLSLSSTVGNHVDHPRCVQRPQKGEVPNSGMRLCCFAGGLRHGAPRALRRPRKEKVALTSCSDDATCKETVRKREIGGDN